MKRAYEKPSVSAMDDYRFECVCAGSGTKAECQFSKTAPDPYNADHLCILCLRALYLDFFGEYVHRPNISSTYEADAAAELLRDNKCPAGYSYL